MCVKLSLSCTVFLSLQLNLHDVNGSCMVQPMYYKHIETIHECPDYPGQFTTVHDKAPVETITKFLIMQVSSAFIKIFHCISIE